MPALSGPVWYMGRRLFTGVLTLLGLATIVFAMVKSIPGDQARVVAGPSATKAQIAQVREQLGLDASLPSQYVDYVGSLLHGDLGTSTTTHRAVLHDILTVLPATIELVILAMFIAVSVSVPAGVIAAARRGRSADSISRVLVVLAAGLPTFWVGLVLQWLLGSRLGILPISGNQSVGVDFPRRTGMPLLDTLLDGNLYAFYDVLQHVILPAAVLAVPVTAQFFRTLRTEMISVLRREHITVALAKGLAPRWLLRKHALPNSFSPVLTLMGVEFGILISSAILVESVFGLPGVGSYLTNAVEQRDLQAVLGSVVVIGVFVVVANFVIDVVQLVRDPRLRAADVGG